MEVAILPAWDSEWSRCPTSSLSAARGVAPRNERSGRRAAVRRTVTSCQEKSPGAPRAFPTASFAATRAAREADGRPRSPGVNSRSNNAGRSEERRVGKEWRGRGRPEQQYKQREEQR